MISKINHKKINSKTYTKKKIYSSKNKKKTHQLKIGCHISIMPSILNGIKYGQSIGGNSFQIFMGSNRSASLKSKTKFEPNECNDIKDYISKKKLTLIIHSIYLLNLCSYPSSSGRIKYQHDNIQHDLKYGSMIGATCVILHIGFKKTLSEDEAIYNLISNINHIVKHMPNDIILALETSACRGSEMGCSLEQLSTIWYSIKHNNMNLGLLKKVGFVIDTAHIFSSGYDISNLNGITNYITQFDNLIGLNNVVVFHINDSKYKLGSRKDEHVGIGNGNIFNTDSGMKSLKYIKKLCNDKNIPMILETHSAAKNDSKDSKDINSYQYEIDLLKKL